MHIWIERASFTVDDWIRSNQRFIVSDIVPCSIQVDDRIGNIASDGWRVRGKSKETRARRFVFLVTSLVFVPTTRSQDHRGLATSLLVALPSKIDSDTFPSRTL